MSENTYQLRSAYIATATALLLNLPPIGETQRPTFVPRQFYEFESLADLGKSVSAALSAETYSSARTEETFALVTETALRLIENSKPLDRDFARVVEKEFWNLL